MPNPAFSCLLSPFSSLLSPFSHLLSQVSCLKSPVSSIVSQVSWLMAHVSCLTSHVILSHICLTAPVSCLTNVSCITFPVSRLFSHVSCLYHFYYLSQVSCLTFPVSRLLLYPFCLLSCILSVLNVSCLSDASCRTSHVPCFTSTVSHLLSVYVSCLTCPDCLTNPFSRLLSHDSYLSHVSCLTFPASWLCA